jgi:hypothetical protein
VEARSNRRSAIELNHRQLAWRNQFVNGALLGRGAAS